MTRNELYDIFKTCGWQTDPEAVFKLIWGQPFDGETERITPQPISTAPEGQRIHLYCHRKETGEGWWEIEGRWMNDEDEPKLGITQPTCWLPLPPLPVTEEYDEDEHRRL